MVFIRELVLRPYVKNGTVVLSLPLLNGRPDPVAGVSQRCHHADAGPDDDRPDHGDEPRCYRIKNAHVTEECPELLLPDKFQNRQHLSFNILVCHGFTGKTLP
jgi:hypothetical protein